MLPNSAKHVLSLCSSVTIVVFFKDLLAGFSEESLAMVARYEKALRAVKRSRFYESEVIEFQTDPVFIEEALDWNGLFLEHVEQAKQSCLKVVLQAVTHNGLALKFASDNLRQNREVILAAVTNNGLALQYCHDELCNSKEMITTAVKHNGSALQCAGDQWRSKPDLVKVAMMQDCNSARFDRLNAEQVNLISKLINASVIQDAPDREEVSESAFDSKSLAFDSKSLAALATGERHAPHLLEALDFAGQKEYYSLFHMFLKGQDICLLVQSLTMWHGPPASEESSRQFRFWLSSIGLHSPEAKVFVVFTKVDEVDTAELDSLCDLVQHKVRDLLSDSAAECFFVDNSLRPPTNRWTSCGDDCRAHAGISPISGTLSH